MSAEKLEQLRDAMLEGLALNPGTRAMIEALAPAPVVMESGPLDETGEIQEALAGAARARKGK